MLGPLVGWIAGALEGAAVGVALASAGIPQDSIIKSETAIRAGKFVVTAYGTPEEVNRARAILASKGYAGRRDLPPASAKK